MPIRYHAPMDGMAWAASAMVAARTRLEIATQNLANVSTDGFRRMAAHGFLTALGVAVAALPARGYGALRHTGRDLDLAITGDGAFVVRDASGRITQTRAGAFVRDRDGTLRDAMGRTLVGTHGRVVHGFLESSGVDAIGEMIDVLAAERSFESAQKAVTAIDSTHQKSAEAARIK
jgi:flagellar basal body rod protein FlgG